MSDCTERHMPPPDDGVSGEGREGMPGRLSMTDCTERHMRPPDDGVSGEGREAMPMEGTA